MVQEEFCPMIEKIIMSREDISEMSCTLKDAIKKLVDQNYYIMVSVNVFYISNWWGNEENRRHFRHQLCVHGYNYEKDVLIISDFIEGKYSIIELIMMNLKKGI